MFSLLYNLSCLQILSSFLNASTKCLLLHKVNLETYLTATSIPSTSTTFLLLKSFYSFKIIPLYTVPKAPYPMLFSDK